MPQDYIASRVRFINELWIPKATDLGSGLLRRARKNKNFRVLSLSLAEDDNVSEAALMIRNGLAQRKDIFLWTCTYVKQLRLESSGFRVIFEGRYEDIVTRSSSSVSGIFPFGIVNLDFVSQDIQECPGRCESEIESIETTFQLQRQTQTSEVPGFVLIYTTIFDSQAVDKSLIRQRLNSHSVSGWQEIDGFVLSGNAVTIEEKAALVETVLTAIARKYSYNVMSVAKMSIDNIFSIVAGLKDI
jgi:hypothetical protein